MKKETYLLFDNEGNIRVYYLTEKEANLIEDVFDWLPLENTYFERITDMAYYESEEN